MCPFYTTFNVAHISFLDYQAIVSNILIRILNTKILISENHFRGWSCRRATSAALITATRQLMDLSK